MLTPYVKVFQGSLGELKVVRKNVFIETTGSSVEGEKALYVPDLMPATLSLSGSVPL